MDDTATYLYGVVDGGVPVDVATTGVGEAPVRSLAAAGLAALVSTVSLSEFGEAPLRDNLENFEWLERTARAHHRVVAAAGTVAPVVPVRLATVYRDDGRVEALLAEARHAFTEALDQVRGRTEWGVKAFLDPAMTDPGQADEPAEAGSSGTAYLLRRRNQQRGREQLRQRAATLADEMHRQLGERSVMSRRHRMQDPQLAGSTGAMILNGAYLTDDASSDALAATVNQLRDAHPDVTLELTGPWVPYSFAEVDADVGRDR